MAHAEEAGFRRVVTIVARAFQIDEMIFTQRWTERGRVHLARAIVMYLARVALGLDYTRIGELANRARRTVARAVENVEDYRVTQEFDALLNRLEKELAHEEQEGWHHPDAHAGRGLHGAGSPANGVSGA